jgi:hypothetical protein
MQMDNRRRSPEWRLAPTAVRFDWRAALGRGGRVLCANASSIVTQVAGESAKDKRGVDADPDDAPDARSARLLDHDDARLQLDADSRDEAADERDAAADERDRDADARDTHAEVRDEAVSDQPDVTGTRRFAAQDRHASSRDRGASADDRLKARADRKKSSWDLVVAERIREQLIASLDDADKMPDVTLLIGQAQGMLMARSAAMPQKR